MGPPRWLRFVERQFSSSNMVVIAGDEPVLVDAGYGADLARTEGLLAERGIGPADREVLTVEYKVNFLAPAHGEKLVARGEVVTAGRRLFICRAEVFAVEGRDERVCATTLQTVSLAPARAPDRKPGA